MHYIFICRSLTYAQSAARYLESNAVSSHVKRAPSQLAGNGCAYAVSVSASKLERAKRLLSGDGRTTGKCYAVNDDGTICEVKK